MIGSRVPVVTPNFIYFSLGIRLGQRGNLLLSPVTEIAAEHGGNLFWCQAMGIGVFVQISVKQLAECGLGFLSNFILKRILSLYQSWTQIQRAVTCFLQANLGKWSDLYSLWNTILLPSDIERFGGGPPFLASFWSDPQPLICILSGPLLGPFRKEIWGKMRKGKAAD